MRDSSARLTLPKLLRRHRVSTWKAARCLGISWQTVRGWCKAVGVPTTQQAFTLAELLGCDLAELYTAIIRTTR